MIKIYKYLVWLKLVNICDWVVLIQKAIRFWGGGSQLSIVKYMYNRCSKQIKMSVSNLEFPCGFACEDIVQFLLKLGP